MGARPRTNPHTHVALAASGLLLVIALLALGAPRLFARLVEALAS